MVPGLWPSLSKLLWIKRMASSGSVVMGSLFLPIGGQQKTRLVGGSGCSGGWWVGALGPLRQFPQQRVGLAGLLFQLVD